jgi:hypothetical protein
MPFIFLSGPYRKSTPRDYRWGAAYLAFFPVVIVGFMKLGNKYFGTAGAFGSWLYLTATFLAYLSFVFVWAKFVPQIVSWSLAAVIWAVVIWMSFTGRIGSN